jgi:hypothetical protein
VAKPLSSLTCILSRLANDITQVAKTGISDGELVILKAQYEALKKLLLTKTEPVKPLPPSVTDNLGIILDLIQHSAYIRRPFHARTAALIKALCYLHEESESNVRGRDELHKYVPIFLSKSLSLCLLGC